MKISAIAEDATFADGANEQTLIELETALKCPLPEQLRSLFAESNGVTADLSADIIWTCERVLEDNRLFRTSEPFRDLYEPFDDLLFFGDDGGGDQFAFIGAKDGGPLSPSVYRWDHETDERRLFADDLAQYLERRLSPTYYDH